MKKAMIAIMAVLVLLAGCNLELVEEHLVTAVVEENAAGVENGFGGGTGIEENPYLISTAAHFERIGEDTSSAYYKLTNDITLPRNLKIDCFYGTLDGDGHTISYSGTESASTLFWALDGATIKDITFYLGERVAPRLIATVTGGNVTLDNVTVDGSIVITGNNSGSGYICYVGYAEENGYINRKAGNVVIKNCTNKLDVLTEDYSLWGIAPFVSGFAMPDVEKDSSLTLENCVNEGILVGGSVGWVFGNQSGIENLKSITINNCSNANGGEVIGYIDSGNISWNGKDTKCTNVTKDESFVDMVDNRAITSTVIYDSTTKTITIDPVPKKDITRAVVIGRYHLVEYRDNELTSTSSHHTQSVVLASSENISPGITGTITIEAYQAVDSRYAGVPENAAIGDIIEINNEKYAYVGEAAEGSDAGILHSCLDTASHKANPSQMWLLGFNGDSIVYAEKVVVK